MLGGCLESGQCFEKLKLLATASLDEHEDLYKGEVFKAHCYSWFRPYKNQMLHTVSSLGINFNQKFSRQNPLNLLKQVFFCIYQFEFFYQLLLFLLSLLLFLLSCGTCLLHACIKSPDMYVNFVLFIFPVFTSSRHCKTYTGVFIFSFEHIELTYNEMRYIDKVFITIINLLYLFSSYHESSQRAKITREINIR